MSQIEQEVLVSVTDLILKLHKDEQKNGESVPGIFLHVILKRLTALGEIMSTKVPKEGADELWQEYQDVVNVVKTGYNCKSTGWSKLLPAIILLYLESPEIFRMFDNKIREAVSNVLKTKQKEVNND